MLLSLENVISQRQSRFFKSEIIGAQRKHDYSFTVSEQKILTLQYPIHVLRNMSHVQSVVLCGLICITSVSTLAVASLGSVSP